MSDENAPDPVDVAARTLIPPAELRRRVSGTPSEIEYVRAAVEYVTILRAVCGLGAEDRVLEPGCGPGRVAAPLTGYLRPPGSYRGFDIHQPSIEFARGVFARWPHFGFDHADIRTEYFLDPPGAFGGQRVSAEAYQFPYPDASFDFVFTVSLYSHMLPDATQRFFGETARVLRPGGHGMLSAWVLDHAAAGAAVDFTPVATREEMQALGLLADGAPPPPVAPPWVALADRAAPTTGVAYSLAFLDHALGAAGLRRRELIRGGWSRPRGWMTLLDVLTFEKR